MNILFFGTSEFAVPALEALATAGLKPAVVVTLPDRPQGRGLEVLPSPVKISAAKLGIAVLQPETVSDPDFLKKLSETSWDVGVIAAYGKIIPQSIIDIPKKGFLNIHPSMLPELRGPSPIQAAILEGKEKTGVTIIVVDSQMDHGPILLQEEMPIETDDTSETLGERLSEKGAELLAQALPQWMNDSLPAKPQNDSKATFCKIIEKEDGHINWMKDAEAIDRQIRAFQPWPGTFSFIKTGAHALRIKIIRARAKTADERKSPGLIERYNHAMIMWTGNGFLSILEVQPEGKRAMSGEEFLNGHQFAINTIVS